MGGEGTLRMAVRLYHKTYPMENQTKPQTQTQPPQTSQSNDAATVKALFVKMAVDAWQTQNTRMNELLEKLSDEELKQPTAPGRNTGTYLLGHLTAVNDNLLVIFGFQEK